jgi:hypothetical protein
MRPRSESETFHGERTEPGFTSGLKGVADVLGHIFPALLVAFEAEPGQGFVDRIDGGLGRALAVGVLDANQIIALAMAREQSAVERRADAADVEVTGGGRGETGAGGHLARLSVELSARNCMRLAAPE